MGRKVVEVVQYTFGYFEDFHKLFNSWLYAIQLKTAKTISISGPGKGTLNITKLPNIPKLICTFNRSLIEVAGHVFRPGLAWPSPTREWLGAPGSRPQAE